MLLELGIQLLIMKFKPFIGVENVSDFNEHRIVLKTNAVHNVTINQTDQKTLTLVFHAVTNGQVCSAKGWTRPASVEQAREGERLRCLQSLFISPVTFALVV